MFFKSKFDPDTFEKELRKLSVEITRNERQLRVWKTKKSQYMRQLPIYLISGYVIYLGYIYMRNRYKNLKVVSFAMAIAMAIGCFIYMERHLLDYIISAKERHIEGLKERHSEKLALLKEKTNFNRTKDMLVRYSNGDDIEELEKEVKQNELKRQEYLKKIENDPNRDSSHVYGGLMDLMMGQDEMSSDRRYALICEKCLQHNGLAPPGEVNVKYICPRCGWLNGSEVKDVTATKSPAEIEEPLDNHLPELGIVQDGASTNSTD
ncbi:hypothetical protein FOA43_001058 [Brettanomyces nanus]|uniref:Endoplasmic reticulum junction formation protein lunapark n=1 Tax=Eeniella nana TaxID=13502 RepID=A0A875S0A5_EENNA|nr:uncharacterized protein FOA43_001058 [Brettanomyces nanus]QPG73745.1 hypothetical protein FOA43_001058 [Brettanomyces nanus]